MSTVMLHLNRQRHSCCGCSQQRRQAGVLPTPGFVGSTPVHALSCRHPKKYSKASIPQHSITGGHQGVGCCCCCGAAERCSLVHPGQGSHGGAAPAAPQLHTLVATVRSWSCMVAADSAHCRRKSSSSICCCWLAMVACAAFCSLRWACSAKREGARGGGVGRLGERGEGAGCVGSLAERVVAGGVAAAGGMQRGAGLAWLKQPVGHACPPTPAACTPQRPSPARRAWPCCWRAPASAAGCRRCGRSAPSRRAGWPAAPPAC
jgi:hypothetical protein